MDDALERARVFAVVGADGIMIHSRGNESVEIV